MEESVRQAVVEDSTLQINKFPAILNHILIKQKKLQTRKMSTLSQY